MRSGRDWSGGSGTGSCHIENRKGCRGAAIPKVFVLDGEKPKAVENGRGSSMGWLIACEQARFFLRLFSRFPSLGHFPKHRTLLLLPRAMPPSILSQLRPPLCTTFLRPATHVAIPSPNYTFIPLCIFASSLQAFNAPDYIMMHESREYIPWTSWFYSTIHRDVYYVRLRYEKEVHALKQNDDRGRITIGLKGCP